MRSKIEKQRHYLFEKKGVSVNFLLNLARSDRQFAGEICHVYQPIMSIFVLKIADIVIVVSFSSDIVRRRTLTISMTLIESMDNIQKPAVTVTCFNQFLQELNVEHPTPANSYYQG